MDRLVRGEQRPAAGDYNRMVINDKELHDLASDSRQLACLNQCQNMPNVSKVA